MDKEGFSKAKKVVRPVPRGATLGDFVPTATRNRFSAMENDAIAKVGSPPARSQPDIDISTRAKPAIPSPTISKKQVKILEELKQKKTIKKMKQNGYVAALDSTLMSCKAKSSVVDDDVSMTEQLKVLENAVLAAISEHRASGGNVNLVGEVNETKILGGYGGTPDTRYPVAAGSVNLVGDGPDNTGFWNDDRVEEINALIQNEEIPMELAGIPGLDRPFSMEETDDFYRDVSETVRAESCNLIFDEDDCDEPAGVVAIAAAKVRVGVAADSGATDNVIGLDDLPDGVVPEGPPGPPFSIASGGDIKKYGKVTTMMENEDGKVGCGWTACAVTRPLHSVSKVCGPEKGPGVQDFMFNNRIGVVMPPGLVDLLLKHIKPAAKYPRRGGLYVGDFEMSSFTRQGPNR